MPKLVFRKHLGSLRPADEQSEGYLRKIANDDLVMAEIKKPRNIGHHCKMFALLNVVCQNIEHPKDPHVLLKYIQQVTGLHCEIIHSTIHGAQKIPKSIAFYNMDQLEFEPFYNAVVDFIIVHVLPGVGRAELEAEVLELVA